MPKTPKRDYRGHGSAYKPELDAVPLAANAQDACSPCRFETATGGGVETRPARQQPCCWHCPQLPLAAQSTCQPKSAREPKKGPSQRKFAQAGRWWCIYSGPQGAQNLYTTQLSQGDCVRGERLQPGLQGWENAHVVQPQKMRAGRRLGERTRFSKSKKLVQSRGWGGAHAF